MLTIQDAGKQILTNNPGKFYIFAGTEYGVKKKYLDVLHTHYDSYVEGDSVSDLIKMFEVRQLIPLRPKLYVVRYDEAFISSMTANTADKLRTLNIIGTIVCVYQNTKHTSKCAKFLDSYTVVFDPVNPEFVCKYLSSDFPTLDAQTIKRVVTMQPDYYFAKNICNCLHHLPHKVISEMDDTTLASLFRCESSTPESQIKLGVAAKNFKFLVDALEAYPDDLDAFFYTILNTMIGLEKAVNNTYAQSEFKPYAPNWKMADVYYMFMNAYEELKKTRTYSTSDVTNSILYLISLLQFQDVPSPEVMS